MELKTQIKKNILHFPYNLKLSTIIFMIYNDMYLHFYYYLMYAKRN